MFDCLVFCDTAGQEVGVASGKQQTSLVFVLLSTFVHLLALTEPLGVTWIFAV